MPNLARPAVKTPAPAPDPFAAIEPRYFAAADALLALDVVTDASVHAILEAALR
jgi:hypothetical protein